MLYLYRGSRTIADVTYIFSSVHISVPYKDFEAGLKSKRGNPKWPCGDFFTFTHLGFIFSFRSMLISL